MSLSYAQLRDCLQGERLPAAIVDLDALDRNLDRVLAVLRPTGMPLRIATKSVRVVEVLRRLVGRAGDRCCGLMCYCAEEAALLADEGFDDLLIAYPAFQHSDLDRAAQLVAQGCRVSLMCDCRETVQRIAGAATAHGVTIALVVCVDMSLQLARGRVHLGVRRSPLGSPAEVVALARFISEQTGVSFRGVMGYEAQVAGLGDDSPFQAWLNPVKGWVRRTSVDVVARRRAAVVAALRGAGLEPSLVNGGGSGSLDSTAVDPVVTEVTAGSAFFKPHLFDYYRSAHMQSLEPACFFALEVTRKPAADHVTCLGGGYVASGAPGPDKVPKVHLPEGLELLAAEMCGEVQTPLRMVASRRLSLGDPVIFRHAKGGELAERFTEMLLLAGGQPVGRAPTYRGQGCCFF